MNLFGNTADVFLRSHSIRAAFAGALIVVLAGCSGGSSSGPSVPPAAAQSVQRVTGTLEIANNAASASVAQRLLSSRGPDYVSAATKHAALFIDQATTPSGITTSCTSSSCTITWSAALNVPASHTFSVEIDDSTDVLAEGQAAYSITPGNNTLATLNLNVVLGYIYENPGTCSSNSCTAQITPADTDTGEPVAANNTTTPVLGTPTSGDVFDNFNGAGSKNFTITSNNSSVGTVTGASASPYASYASGTFSILGLNATDTYSPTVACVSGATGTFGLTLGTGTPSGDITSAELTGLSLTYPTVVSQNSSNFYTCSNGTISETASAAGTLPVK